VRIQVLYFGVIRERVSKKTREDLAVPHQTTVQDLLDRLYEEYPGLTALQSRFRIVVNKEFAGPDHILTDGDIAALIPPVAGGSQTYIRLTKQPLDLDEAINAIAEPDKGNIAFSVDLVRDHSLAGTKTIELEYEAYEEMAYEKFAEIIAQCQHDMPGIRIAIAHRLGKLKVGELIRIVAVGAPTRSLAYEALGTCADLVGAAPIWKKEIGPDSEEWVDSTCSPV
jgi:molybdopterin synthase catalytic subunit/molybdopterin converting factor small subunit